MTELSTLSKMPKSGDVFFCKKDVYYEESIHFSQGKNYTVNKLQNNDFIILLNNNNHSFAFDTDENQRFYFWDFFCTLKELRMKKLKKLMV